MRHVLTRYTSSKKRVSRLLYFFFISHQRLICTLIHILPKKQHSYCSLRVALSFVNHYHCFHHISSLYRRPTIRADFSRPGASSSVDFFLCCRWLFAVKSYASGHESQLVTMFCTHAYNATNVFNTQVKLCFNSAWYLKLPPVHSILFERGRPCLKCPSHF